MKSVNTSYVPAIDHLRAFAAALVLFHHALQRIGGRLAYNGPAQLYDPPASTPLDALIIEGHTGVALFMVLSGFIFTHIAHDRDVRYGPFLANRILRIYPLMLFMFLVGWLVRPSSVGAGGLLGLILIPFSISHPVGFWFVPDIHPFTTLFWAIAVEFKFYLLFPLLLGLVHRDGARVLAILLAGAVILRIVLVWDGAQPGSLSYWTIFGRIDQFLIGMGAAIVYRAWPNPPGAILCLGALLAMAFLLFGFNRAGGFESQANWKVLWPTVEGAVWAAFIIGYLQVSTRLPGWLSSALAFLGEISFSIYLLHLTVIAALIRIGPVHFGLGPAGDALLNALLFVSPATIAVSSITFRLIERPFLRARVHYLGGSAHPEPPRSRAVPVRSGSGVPS